MLRVGALDNPAVVFHIKAIVAEVEETAAVIVENLSAPAPGCAECRTFDTEEQLSVAVQSCHFFKAAIMAVNCERRLFLRYVAF